MLPVLTPEKIKLQWLSTTISNTTIHSQARRSVLKNKQPGVNHSHLYAILLCLVQHCKIPMAFNHHKLQHSVFCNRFAARFKNPGFRSGCCDSWARTPLFTLLVACHVANMKCCNKHTLQIPLVFNHHKLKHCLVFRACRMVFSMFVRNVLFTTHAQKHRSLLCCLRIDKAHATLQNLYNVTPGSTCGKNVRQTGIAATPSGVASKLLTTTMFHAKAQSKRARTTKTKRKSEAQRAAMFFNSISLWGQPS